MSNKFANLFSFFCSILFFSTLSYIDINNDFQLTAKNINYCEKEKYALIEEHHNFQNSYENIRLRHTELMIEHCLGCREKLNIWRKKWKTPQELRQIAKDQAYLDMQNYEKAMYWINKGMIFTALDDLESISPNFKYYSKVKYYLKKSRDEHRIFDIQQKKELAEYRRKYG